MNSGCVFTNSFRRFLFVILRSLPGFIEYVEDDVSKGRRSQSEPPLVKGQILEEEDLANELGTTLRRDLDLQLVWMFFFRLFLDAVKCGGCL